MRGPVPPAVFKRIIALVVSAVTGPSQITSLLYRVGVGLKGKLGDLADRVLDWTVLPGFSRIGYALRENLVPRGPLELEGKTVMLTGASSGIGEAACGQLARAGAQVLMVVRDPEKGERSRQEILAGAPSAVAELIRCDVSELSSVREAAAHFLDSGLPLDVLINNAGVLPTERRQTSEGIELTFATNVLGPFLLTALLLPALEAAAPSRVINVSSGGMYAARLDLDDLQLVRREFDGARFYAHTKRIEVALAGEWSRRLAGCGVAVHSVHPGWVATPGVTSSLPRFDRVMKPLLRNPDAGADTIVWLAGSRGATKHPGAFWHDRRVRPKHRVPWTRESAAERAALFDRCAALCGLDPDAAAKKRVPKYVSNSSDLH
jgi:NAD(P)-dependent dehydrogenase (short-subunit alcohol dehydrogenase family)